jgi:hypothetical protein
MSKQIASSVKDFAFETLLMMAIQDEKLHDGEGTEDDPSEGTGFEPVHSVAPALNTSPIPHSSTSRPVSPLSTTSPANMRSSDIADSDATDSESGPDSDTATPATHKRKRKSKATIAYKKLAFKKRRAADRQRAKDDLDPNVKVRPSIRKRHTASATPINVPSFSIDTKVPAQTGYVAIRDPKANKQVYKLGEMVGEGSKFRFNLVEWDGKYVLSFTLSL